MLNNKQWMKVVLKKKMAKIILMMKNKLKNKRMNPNLKMDLMHKKSKL